MRDVTGRIVAGISDGADIGLVSPLHAIVNRVGSAAAPRAAPSEADAGRTSRPLRARAAGGTGWSANVSYVDPGHLLELPDVAAGRVQIHVVDELACDGAGSTAANVPQGTSRPSWAGGTRGARWALTTRGTRGPCRAGGTLGGHQLPIGRVGRHLVGVRHDALVGRTARLHRVIGIVGGGCRPCALVGVALARRSSGTLRALAAGGSGRAFDVCDLGPRDMTIPAFLTDVSLFFAHCRCAATRSWSSFCYIPCSVSQA